MSKCRTNKNKFPLNNCDGMEPFFYSVKGVCRAYGLGKTTVFELLASKRLTKIKHGSRTLVPKASVDQYAAELIAEQGGDHGCTNVR